MNLSVTLAWICMSSQGTKSNPPIFIKSENPIKRNNKKKRIDGDNIKWMGNKKRKERGFGMNGLMLRRCWENGVFPLTNFSSGLGKLSRNELGLRRNIIIMASSKPSINPNWDEIKEKKGAGGKKGENPPQLWGENQSVGVGVPIFVLKKGFQTRPAESFGYLYQP